MEFINAEDKVPTVEVQIWNVVEEKLATSYATVYDGETKKSSQSCTAKRAIDATKDFNIKTGKAYNFLAGFRVYTGLNENTAITHGDADSLQTFTLEGAKSALALAAFSIAALSTTIF